LQNLGGDSIVAMRLVGAAREEGLSMTVADVFKNPTFADMARVSELFAFVGIVLTVTRLFVLLEKSSMKSFPKRVDQWQVVHPNQLYLHGQHHCGMTFSQ
jgi:hypothetical protein